MLWPILSCAIAFCAAVTQAHAQAPAPSPVDRPAVVAAPASGYVPPAPPPAPAAAPYQGGPLPYGYYPPPPRPRPRLSKGMMITGISILGGSYGLAGLVGFILLDNCRGGSDCTTIGGELLVPVLGPFLAAATFSDEGGGIFVAWGLIQAVGAGLMIGGIVKYKNSKRRAEEEGYLVFNLPRGKTLAIDASVSSQLTGPRMRLRF